MEFLSDFAYWKLAVPTFAIAFIDGFTSLSQGRVGRHLALQALFTTTCLVLLVFVFLAHRWLAGIITLLVGWTIMGIGGRIQMSLFEKSAGCVHPDRSAPEKIAVFLAAFRQAKHDGLDDHNAHLYAQAKAGGYFPMPDERE